MSLLGDITNAGKDLVHSTESVADAAGQSLSREVQDTLRPIKDVVDPVAHQAELLGEGALTGAVLRPINGIDQLASHVTGFHLPQIELPNQQEVNDSWAGKIGNVAGTVGDFVATGGAVSAATGLEAGSVSVLGISGAIQGGILSPGATDKSGGAFFLDRIENGAIGAGAYATMGLVAGKVAGALGGAVGESILGKVAAQGVAKGSGLAARTVAASESNAIIKRGTIEV
jgi:hypothetical protein